MSIEEFIAKFIQQEEATISQVVFAFLGYATLAIGGLLLVYKEYCKESEPSILRNASKVTRLSIGSFIFAVVACFILMLKFDGRKKFCIVWLPATRMVYPDTRTDDELIDNFLEDYHRFNIGKGPPEHVERYLRQEQKYCKFQLSLLNFPQREWLNILIVPIVFFSIHLYVTAIRWICLSEAKAQ